MANALNLVGKRVHFIGLGGVSMSALARLLEINDKAIISGSDANVLGHSAKNISREIDLVIINGAISDDNPELLKAQQLNIPILTRAELLAYIESKYINKIAVAGSHGKSTTTAMIGAVLAAGGLNPTVHNGAMPNLLVGGKGYFVTEACEFKRSFLLLKPTVGVITNIDIDHMDCYNNLEEIQEAFNSFASNSKVVLRCDELCKEVSDIEEYSRGKYSFKLLDTTIKLGVVGRHNIHNACAAAHVGLHFGIDIKVIATALENFSGISRRFEFMRKLGECDLITDYAHHPVELETTISTANDLYGEDNYLIVFQPHTYTRTIALFDDFIRVLKGANSVLYKTFSAREKPKKGGSARDLALASGKKYFHEKQLLSNYIDNISKNYRAIILTGAGDVNTVIS